MARILSGVTTVSSATRLRGVMARPITFLSDFGLRDEFVGVVHGVIAKLAPDSTLIDLTHHVPRGNVKSGALALTRAIQYLPEGVLLAVVDPGVGTDRRAIAVETPWGHLVGPDNGVLSPAVAMVGGASRIVSIENPEARIPSAGATFHGRDVFAPAAALLAVDGTAFDDLGPSIDPESALPMMLPLPEVENNAVTGEVWWIDGFGNAQTNVGPEDLDAIDLTEGDLVTIRVRGVGHEARWVSTYGDVEPRELLVHVDSAGLVAVASRGDSAAEQLGLAEDLAIILQRS